MNTVFIAEISGNHNGSLNRALDLVQIASAAGVTHLKLQTYTADSITLDVDDSAFRLSESHPLWGGKSLHELYQNAFTPMNWHVEIFALARKLGMTPFSTPFDEAAVDFLETLDVELYKIASMEIVDLPLISYTASKGKPMIISTGTASLVEVDEAVEAAKSAGCVDLTLLVCTSDYPAAPENANLARIPFLRDKYNCEVGLSDHTIGTHVAMAAIALGASTIEKHICISRDDGGVDSGFSATPEELSDLVKYGREVASAIGSSDAWDLDEESQSRSHRPSIIITKDISAGEELTLDNIATLRPNIGLPPKFLPRVLGGRAAMDLKRGKGLSFNDIQ
jgi:N-acetylneuraminate synthase